MTKNTAQLLQEQIEGRIELAKKLAKSGPQARAHARTIKAAAQRDAARAAHQKQLKEAIQ